MTLEEFNALPEAEARDRLATCLDVGRWVDTVLEGRPYADTGALLAVGRNAAELDEAELEAALARHPGSARRPEPVTTRRSRPASSPESTATTRPSRTGSSPATARTRSGSTACS